MRDPTMARTGKLSDDSQTPWNLVSSKRALWPEQTTTNIQRLEEEAIPAREMGVERSREGGGEKMKGVGEP